MVIVRRATVADSQNTAARETTLDLRQSLALLKTDPWLVDWNLVIA
jgi:hypothetical protein